MLEPMEAVNRCIMLFAADWCQAAPVIRNAVTSFDLKKHLMTVTCLPGFRFSDGAVSKDFTCDSEGVWPDVSACKRTYSDGFCRFGDARLARKILYGSVCGLMDATLIYCVKNRFKGKN